MSHDFEQLTISFTEKSLQFLQPAGTSRGVYLERKVWYVEAYANYNGLPVYGIGECAPLPQLSCDDVPNYVEILAEACRLWQTTQVFPREFLKTYPSILMGFETAQLSLYRCAETGNPFLLSSTPFALGNEGIPINGLVWMGNAEEMQERMKAKLAAGFRCVKIKIGAIDFEAELNLLSTLRQHYSPQQVELRLDANGAFSPQEAIEKLRLLSAFNIHSIEQPIRAGQWIEMAELCRQSPIPIALDEELIGVHSKEEKERLLDTIKPQYIILKPSLHGGFSGAEEWEELADARGIAHWATSALESNVGLNAIAHWTARRQEEKAKTGKPLMPQGLGTGQLFANNYDAISLEIKSDELWNGEEADRVFWQQLSDFSKKWNDERLELLEFQTSGSTGNPKTITLSKKAMRASAQRTLSTLDIKPESKALLCLPLHYVAGKMMAVRAFVGKLQLLTSAPSLHPFAQLKIAPQFVALTPLQAAATLEIPKEKELLASTECVILGGGSVSESLEESLQCCRGKVYSTYGMTETLSHIALRRINGSQRSDWYTPLEGVSIALNAEGCLVITDRLTNEHPLHTNDMGEINALGQFRILGRRDNVVCSGGLKLHIEELERKLQAEDYGLQLTSVPDDALGEALVCLHTKKFDQSFLQEWCKKNLTKHEQPRYFLCIENLPLTETGKPARAIAKEMAIQAL